MVCSERPSWEPAHDLVSEDQSSQFCSQARHQDLLGFKEEELTSLPCRTAPSYDPVSSGEDRDKADPPCKVRVRMRQGHPLHTQSSASEKRRLLFSVVQARQETSWILSLSGTSGQVSLSSVLSPTSSWCSSASQMSSALGVACSRRSLLPKSRECLLRRCLPQQ